MIRYAAHPGWWGGGPTIDTPIFAIIPDPAMRMTRLKAGECRMVAYPAPADMPGPGPEKAGSSGRIMPELLMKN